MVYKQEEPISPTRLALYSLGSWLVGSLLMGIFSGWLDRMLALCLSSIIVFICPLLLLGRGRWLMARISKREWLHFFRARSVYRIPLYLLPVLLSLVVLPISSALASLSQLLISHLPTSWGIDTSDHIHEHVSELLKDSSFLARGLQLFTFAILPAFVEELYFRGQWQPLLQQRLGRHQGIWLVGLLFSLVHLSALGFASRLFIGLCLGYSYDRTRSLPTAICLHMLNNTVSLALLLD